MLAFLANVTNIIENELWGTLAFSTANVVQHWYFWTNYVPKFYLCYHVVIKLPCYAKPKMVYTWHQANKNKTRKVLPFFCVGVPVTASILYYQYFPHHIGRYISGLYILVLLIHQHREYKAGKHLKHGSLVKKKKKRQETKILDTCKSNLQEKFFEKKKKTP